MRAIILWLAAVLCCGSVHAQVPHTINYQGFLTSAGGAPVNAPVQMVLNLYNVVTGGSALHSEVQTVPVANGVFNVVIGLQPANPLTQPFDKSYWLGVTVGTDAEMTPRVALAASPYALSAAGVDGTAALPAAQITGALGAGQIGTAAVSLANINATGTSASRFLASDGANLLWANPGGVQTINAGPGLTGGGSNQGTINLAVATNGITQPMLAASGGTSGQVLSTTGSALQWANATPGTVTNVTATVGGGLATAPAGGIVASGSVGITAGGVQTAMVADGAISAAKLALSQQLPDCSDGQGVRRLAGAWICFNLPPVLSIPRNGYNTTIAGGTSMAIGTDGFPIISYTGAANLITVVKCLDAHCAGFTTNGTWAGEGYDPAIAIGNGGLPVVVFRDGSSHLAVARCFDANCTNGQLTTIDSGKDTGWLPSVAVPADGFPIIGYHDRTSNLLRVVKCVDYGCGLPGTITPIGSGTTGVAARSVILIGSDGLPVIAFFGTFATLTTLNIYHCTNPSCTAGAGNGLSQNVIASGTTAYLVMAISAFKYPIVGYNDSISGRSILKCLDASCAGFSSAPSYSVGQYVSMAAGTDGIPVFASTLPDAGLTAAKCTDSDCASPVIVNTLDAAANITSDTLIAVPPDGLPVVLYLDSAVGALKVAKCGNATCQYP